MEKLTKYRQIVRQLLTTHATTNEPNIECQLIFDTEHDHYQLLDLGWQGLNRIYACYIHLGSAEKLHKTNLDAAEGEKWWTRRAVSRFNRLFSSEVHEF